MPSLSPQLEYPLGTVFVRRSSTGAVKTEFSVVICGFSPSGTVIRLILMAGPPDFSSVEVCPVAVKQLNEYPH